MNPRDRSRRRILSADERTLWSTVTRSVAPLRDLPPAKPDEEATALGSPPPRGPNAAPETAPAASVAPPLVPLGRRLRARVARGRAAIDARLDLHGLTQNEAHAALLGFVRAAHARGARLVLVITGKGRRTDGEGERGVLRRQAPQWLRLPEFRAFVIGIEDAHAAHGGEGALYVRIRRKRGE